MASRPRCALRIITVAAFATLGVISAACGDTSAVTGGDSAEDLSPRGPRRSFSMGFSTLPPEETDASYRDAFELAGRYGEYVLIQRPVPWDEFLPGDAQPSEQLRDTTRLETTLAERENLNIALAIDPTDPADRHRLAPLPDALRAQNFASEDLQRSYLTYVRYMAANYRPAYMALAVDINWLAGGNPQEFDRFLPVYERAYDIVKEVSPETRVVVTFQYEELLGQLPWNPHEPDWELIDRFGERLDAFAVGTFPSLLDQSIQQLPGTYYSQIRDHTDLPIVLMDMGYSSGPGAAGINAGGEAEQAQFLRRVFGAADQLGIELIIWFIASDPSYLFEPPLDSYANVGLRAASGDPKAAWDIWVQSFRRPYGEDAADTGDLVPRRRNPIATATPSGGQPPDSGGGSRDPFESPTGAATATPPPDQTPGITPTPIR